MDMAERKEEVPLGIEVNECGFHVSRIIGCLASSKHAQAEKAAIDLVGLAKEHVVVKKQLADARDALAFIDRILTNDPNEWACKAAIAACRKQLLLKGK